MLLITGAAGKTGLAILGKLVEAKGDSHDIVNIRAMVRRSEQIATVKSSGATDVTVGDVRNPQDVARALAGVETVYHICPNMQPDEVAIARTLVKAAKAVGVKRIVYHSVLHPQTQEMPHHWNKLQVEEMLFTSGIGYTILQPAAYMQNVLANWQEIMQQGIYRVPYQPETVLGMVNLDDVAEVAAKVLKEPTHDGAIYELATNERLTQHECAQVLAKVLRQPVQAMAVNRERWRQGAVAAGLTTYAIETLLKMFCYYERYGFYGNGTVMAALLERQPTTFEAFARRMARQ